MCSSDLIVVCIKHVPDVQSERRLEDGRLVRGEEDVLNELDENAVEAAVLKVKQLYGEAQLQEYGARLRLGRVSHTDDRGWFFDTEFDGVEATLEQGPWQVVAFYAHKNQAVLLENNQTADGIKIPKKLAEYTKFDIIS